MGAEKCLHHFLSRSCKAAHHRHEIGVLSACHRRSTASTSRASVPYWYCHVCGSASPRRCRGCASVALRRADASTIPAARSRSVSSFMPPSSTACRSHLIMLAAQLRNEMGRAFCAASSLTHIFCPLVLLNQYSAPSDLLQCLLQCGGPGRGGAMTLCPGKSSSPRWRHCGPPASCRASPASRAAATLDMA